MNNTDKIAVKLCSTLKRFMKILNEIARILAQNKAYIVNYIFRDTKFIKLQI